MATYDIILIPTVSKARADELGLDKFYTGEPCRNGHITWRYGSTHQCNFCVKDSALARKARLSGRARNYKASYQKRRERILENQKKRRATCERHKARNRCRARLNKAKRKMLPGAHTAQEERSLLAAQDYLCRYCRKFCMDKWHADHFMPLYLGGRNDIENIRIACPECNQRKGKMHPLIWVLKNKGLLDARLPGRIQCDAPAGV